MFYLNAVGYIQTAGNKYLLTSIQITFVSFTVTPGLQKKFRITYTFVY